jgi:lipoprotein-anchoring transpeptidase ErfK/SrfK
VGPLPSGKYTIGLPYDDHQVGKFALPLIPDPTNEMHGRSLFRIHGDNPHLNHTASHGCIILAHPLRESIAKSSDKELVVEL